MDEDQKDLSLPTTDMRAEVPDLGRYLLPGERVVNVERFNIKRPDKPLSSVQALAILAGVTSSLEVGNNGPVVASRATKENEGIDGLGLFETPFGRDSLTVALLLHKKYPRLTQATVKKAAELQGVQLDLDSEEEVGKIFHEERHPDDPSVKRLIEEAHWKFPYYGSIDATPLFIQAVGVASKDNHNFLKETYHGRDQQIHTFEYAFDQAVIWLEKQTAKTTDNPEGLLEFKRLNTRGGIINQSWKDSGDSYMHADGTLANHNKGIASIEVQAQAYDSFLNAAEVYEQLRHVVTDEQREVYGAKVQRLRAKALDIRQKVLDIFWNEDERGGYFALGTDRDEQGDIRPLQVRSSNMGRLLNSRIFDGNDPEIVHKREAVIRTLFSDEMLAASGIRTLSNREVRFRPGAYHNGSVWLFDTYLIALGLERHSYYGLAESLKERIGNVVTKFNKFPEFARGGDEEEPMLNERIVDIFDENTGSYNRIEQPPQEIQAWSVASVVAEKFDRNPLRSHLPKLTSAIDWGKRQLELELLTTHVLRAA